MFLLPIIIFTQMLLSSTYSSKKKFPKKITNNKTCAVFAHPDDELNILGLLGNKPIDIYYLTKGESGFRHASYYGNDTNEIKKIIKDIRLKETEKLSNKFNFTYTFFDFPDINNQTKTQWNQQALHFVINNITKNYDTVYAIGALKREHHQHIQIANVLNSICPDKVIYGNWYMNSLNEIKNELPGVNFIDYKYDKVELSLFISILKSQGTLKEAINCNGFVTYKK
jgi:LmbE family N-acetylglucosaminyl deacetylase